MGHSMERKRSIPPPGLGFRQQSAEMSAPRRTRSLDAPSLLAFVPLVLLTPVWLIALAVFWWPLSRFVAVPYWAVVVGHLGIGLALLFRSAQQFFLTRILGARLPTPAERRHLEPLWQGVLLHTRMGRRRFVLAVSDSDELNAFASGGNLVVITTGAINLLPAAELQGVMAHEIGHHLGLESVAVTLGYWLALPVVVLARVGFFLQNVARAATESFAHSSIFTAIGKAIAAVLMAVAWVFQSAIIAWQSISGAASRKAEYRADERAVQLGFGPELAAAMRRSAVDEMPAGARTWAERLFGSHPPLRTRIAKVEAMSRRVPRSDDLFF
jgi:Zn-dependent protease with chaperone function